MAWLTLDVSVGLLWASVRLEGGQAASAEMGMFW